MENKNFCYWQEQMIVSVPNFNKKICLLRETEYKIEKESGIIDSGLKKGTNIFCPYENAEQAIECMEYKVSNGKNSK